MGSQPSRGKSVASRRPRTKATGSSGFVRKSKLLRLPGPAIVPTWLRAPVSSFGKLPTLRVGEEALFSAP